MDLATFANKDDVTIAKKVASHLHDYTHGINSDPVTLFAIVFSALIHDVDHRGVSNVQLIKEEPSMAKLFRNKSIAEQNSLEIAWQLLVSDRFIDLRNYIFASEDDLLRFRQIIVNVVLATGEFFRFWHKICPKAFCCMSTLVLIVPHYFFSSSSRHKLVDIFDKELNELRKLRWDKAFAEKSVLNKAKNSFRATIVMEHIMQASDVCHTMQHWHVYRKWNQRLFHEMFLAYKAGRMGSDPRTFWYKGELSFFDNYIIPLAKKLKECNVFGASSDECLNFALKNRGEWEISGEQLVAEMIEEMGNTK